MGTTSPATSDGQRSSSRDITDHPNSLISLRNSVEQNMCEWVPCFAAPFDYNHTRLRVARSGHKVLPKSPKESQSRVVRINQEPDIDRHPARRDAFDAPKICG